MIRRSSMKCKHCGSANVKRDVPAGKFAKDCVGVIAKVFTFGILGGSPERTATGHTVRAVVDYWTNDDYYICNDCGKRGYD
jgi:hypothetical protein